MDDLITWLTQIPQRFQRAFAWLTCRLTGHRRIHRINKVDNIEADLVGLRMRVVDSDYYCARCGKDPLP